MEYDLKLIAKDQDGNKAEYYVSRFTGEEECKGYMLNAEIFEDGRIHTAGPVEITLYAVKLPEGLKKGTGNFVKYLKKGRRREAIIVPPAC